MIRPLSPPPEHLPAETAEHEMSVLGSMLIDPRCVDRIRGMVDSSDFADTQLGELFQAFLTIHDSGKPLGNVVVVRSELRNLGLPSSTHEAAFIARILNTVPNAAHAVFHAETIRHEAHKRRWYYVGWELCRQANDRQSSPAEIVSFLEAQTAAMANAEVANARTLADVAQECITEIEQARTAPAKPGILSDLHSLDECIGPMMPGELVIVAARPGCGKTAFALQHAVHAGECGKRVLFVSLEMRDRELVRRILCQRAELDSRDVRQGRVNENDLSRMRGISQELKSSKVKVWSPPRAHAAQMRGLAKYEAATNGLDMLVVDYLGLVVPSADERRLQRYEQVGRVTAAMKALAKELSIPVMLLAQLSRETEKHEVPRLSHLRESGSIEQDADMVLLLHHPEKDSFQQPNTGTIREAHLIVAKHRHGETGLVKLNWQPSATMFGDASLGREWQP